MVVVVSLKNLPLILALPFIVVDLDFTSLCVVCKMGPFRRFKDTRCAKHKIYIEHPHAKLKFLLLETRDPLTAQALEPRAGGESSRGYDIPRASKHIFPASSSSQRLHHCPDSLEPPTGSPKPALGSCLLQRGSENYISRRAPRVGGPRDRPAAGTAPHPC